MYVNLNRWTFTAEDVDVMTQTMAQAGHEELARRLTEISKSFYRRSGDNTDLAIVQVSPQGQTYVVTDWGEASVVINAGGSVLRPVGEKVYDDSTHAYRACRRLNEAATANDQHLEAWEEQERERLNERALAEEAHQKRFAEEIQEVLGFNDLPSTGSL